MYIANILDEAEQYVASSSYFDKEKLAKELLDWWITENYGAKELVRIIVYNEKVHKDYELFVFEVPSYRRLTDS